MILYRFGVLGFSAVFLAACGSSDVAKTAEPEGASTQAQVSCEDQAQTFAAMSDAELFQRALNHEVGNCYVKDTSACTTCSCWAEVKVSTANWSYQGWPLDLFTHNSTGCVSDYCFPQYKDAMCTPDMVANAAAQLRDALRFPNDVCGFCDPDKVITVGMVIDNFFYDR